MKLDLSNVLIAAPVNNEEVFRDNLLASPLAKRPGINVIARRGYPCAGKALNEVIRKAGASQLVVCAHQDVFLPEGWEQRLFSNIRVIEGDCDNWGVLGVYGISSQSRRAGKVWSTGLGKEIRGDSPLPVEVQSLDELLLVIRADTDVLFDEDLPGFHLYGTDIVQNAYARGLKAFVIDAPVIHNSLPVAYLGVDYWQAYLYLRRKWKERLPIHTAVVPITSFPWELIKHNLTSFVKSATNRRGRPTRHKNPAQLADQLAYSHRRASYR